MYIYTKRRNEGWIAAFSLNFDHSVIGSTEAEDVGKLIISVSQHWKDGIGSRGQYKVPWLRNQRGGCTAETLGEQKVAVNK